jgi:hypothetical protein
MTAYYVFVKCPDCSSRWCFGLTHDKDGIGVSTLADCPLCKTHVTAVIERFELAPPDESDESPIRGRVG